MKGAKSLQIHSHNIFSRLLSKEYGVYQQFIYIVTAFSESKIEAPWFEKYEQACWEWNTRAFEMNAILDIQSGLLPSDCCPTFLSFKKGTQWGFPGGSVVKNLSANAGDSSSNPGQGRFHVLQSS